MPYRSPQIKTNAYYHIFNRSIASEQIFLSPRSKKHFLGSAEYYRLNTFTPYSIYKSMSSATQHEFLGALLSTNSRVDIVAFAIMPTHYHFILRQRKDEGIKQFIRGIEISFAKRYNLTRKRHGGVFSHRYGSVQIGSSKQLYRTSRYIHLNPVKAGIVTLDELEDYQYTSYSYYKSRNTTILFKPVMKGFSNFNEYSEFLKSNIMEDIIDF